MMLFLSTAACAEPVNLITNPGFENGDGGINGKQKGVAKGWETICGGTHPEIYALDRGVKHSGKYSQRMTCHNYNYCPREDGAYCYHVEDGANVRHPCSVEIGLQAIAQTTAPGAVKPECEYASTAWVKIDGLVHSWEWFRISIYWLDAKKKFIAETRQDYRTSKNDYGTHDWKLIKITAKSPEKAAFAKVYLHHHFTEGTVWYDDLTLIELDDSK